MLGLVKGLAGISPLKETAANDALCKGMMVEVLRVSWREPPLRQWCLLIPGGPGKSEDELIATAGCLLTFQPSGPPYICKEGKGGHGRSLGRGRAISRSGDLKG